MIKRNFEIGLFVALNVFLSLAMLVMYTLFHFATLMAVAIGVDPLSANDSPYVFVFACCFLAYWVLKPFIFCILYKYTAETNGIHCVLSRFLKDIKFRVIVLISAILLDLTAIFTEAVINPTDYISFARSLSAAFEISLFMLGGVTTCWLAFWVISTIGRRIERNALERDRS